MNWIFGIIVRLGVLILVHEWGHFVVARFFGVRVDVFSIGFGPRLFGWKRGATDYRVSALPLGGYVRMAGQDLSDVDSGKVAPTGAPDELMSKPRWQRALISFAGPAVNLIFPIILLTGFFLWVGIPHPAYLDKPVQVVGFPANEAQASSPLKVGDTIRAINGTPTPSWEQAEKALKQVAPGGTLKLDVENNGTQRHVNVVVKDIEGLDRFLGVSPIPAVIDAVEPGLPAARAGVQAGDSIIGINGHKVEYWEQFVDSVRGSNGQQIAIDVERKGKALHMQVTPQLGSTESGEKVYQVGVLNRLDMTYSRASFSESFKDAGLSTIDTIQRTVGVVGKLLSGRVSLKQLQGPVGISRASGEATRRGPLAVISLMVFISVNLGILNLLPIPILDGGNILLLTLEGIRRRDFSLAFKERFIQVGLVFLLVLFAYVMYNDVVRLLPSHS